MKLIALKPFGAEIRGLDLARVIDAEQAEIFRSMLFSHQFLVFRRQSLTPPEQVRFSRCFGELEPGLSRRPQEHKVPGHADVLYLSNEPGSATSEYGMGWHSDGLAYAKKPHGATILHCLSCPAGSGATAFADQYAAYASLSEETRRELSRHSWYLPRILHSEIPENGGLAHPFFRMHTITKRPFIFCAPNARQIRGLTVQESAPLLEKVHSAQTNPAWVAIHEWNPGDVVVWENATLLHTRVDRVNFDARGLRAMHRTATQGDFPAIMCEPADETID